MNNQQPSHPSLQQLADQLRTAHWNHACAQEQLLEAERKYQLAKAAAYQKFLSEDKTHSQAVASTTVAPDVDGALRERNAAKSNVLKYAAQCNGLQAIFQAALVEARLQAAGQNMIPSTSFVNGRPACP